MKECCIERGGCSTNHKGVLAQYLNTTIPEGKSVFLCHACHNGKCSNPKHLYWGTAKENVHDAIQNGNFGNMGKKGKGHPQTEETKLKISETLKGRPSNNKKGINGITYGNFSKGYTYKRKNKQIWINNDYYQTRINESNIIPEGYKRGRLK